MVELEFFIILGGIHHISHIRLQERDGLESFRHEGGGFETSIGRAHSASEQGILEETTLQLHLARGIPPPQRWDVEWFHFKKITQKIPI